MGLLHKYYICDLDGWNKERAGEESKNQIQQITILLMVHRVLYNNLRHISEFAFIIDLLVLQLLHV